MKERSDDYKSFYVLEETTDIEIENTINSVQEVVDENIVLSIMDDMQAAKLIPFIISKSFITGFELRCPVKMPITIKVLTEELEKGNSTLSFISLDEWRGGGILPIITSLKNVKTLQSLHVRVRPADLSEDSFKSIAELVQDNILKDLDIRLMIGQNRYFEYIFQALEGSESLTNLCLLNNYISDEEAKHLAKVLEKNNTLSVLKIKGSNTSDIGAEYLANALKNNNTLSSFKFDSYQTLNEVFSEMLKFNYNITEISLPRPKDNIDEELYRKKIECSKKVQKYISDNKTYIENIVKLISNKDGMNFN